MNVWKITAPQKLSREDIPVPEPEEGELRVRITKALLSGTDVSIFNGAIKTTKYPLVPGRFAVGQIASQNESGLFPKGTRVLLHAYRAARDCGTEKKDFTEDEIDILGMTKDGFLRDFVLTRPDEMTPLPDSVSDNDALLVHDVAIAKAVVDKLGAKKGSHIAVIGADLMGILVCLLLIYQQVSPVLIDADAERLDFAHKCGVYYTLPSSDAVLDKVAAVTGGRLADGAVYISSGSTLDPTLAFLVTARGGDVVICAPDRRGFPLDFSLAIRKQISVYGISDPEGSLETAINLIVSKAINLDFIRSSVSFVGNVGEFFKKYDSESATEFCMMHLFSLL